MQGHSSGVSPAVVIDQGLDDLAEAMAAGDVERSAELADQRAMGLGIRDRGVYLQIAKHLAKAIESDGDRR